MKSVWNMGPLKEIFNNSANNISGSYDDYSQGHHNGSALNGDSFSTRRLSNG